MRPIRLIARLDIKGPNLIKGIHLEGLRVIGDPQTYAQRYYEQGIDEIIYMDTVASLYGRNNLTEILEHTAHHVFVPITVGGGVRSVEDARKLLRSGADKVAINTAAIARPELISEIAEEFGSQAVVLSVEAKRQNSGGWEAYTDNGREHSGRDVIEWVQEAEKLGAGELLLTSIDQEGTRKGFDIALLSAISGLVSIPVIASGGMGSVEDLVAAVQDGHADAVAMADILHYDRMTIAEIRDQALAANMNIRELSI
ncbi:imidazole glycerol phosphate synthase subunit HisF [Nisaea denitrificans]|uniref:imidazole glycerol phosphate synthase subunit HisF n=1 Tax=Nisaea denitrificans TaxID=390877 RepID=UPI00040B279F|nr:imidazole glycerol phosphate synthase cyclase subunit [Nisaea denitrificans]